MQSYLSVTSSARAAFAVATLYASTPAAFAQSYYFTFTPGLSVSINERLVDGQIFVADGKIQSVTGFVYNRATLNSGVYGTINGILSPNSFYSGYPAVYGQPLSVLNDNSFNHSSPFLSSNGFAFTSGSGNVSVNISALSGSPQQYALYAEGGGVYPGEMTFSPAGGASESGPVCFCRGTLVSTAHGLTDVSNLRIEMLVETIEGLRRVRWIGRMTFHRRLDGTFKDDVYPVRVLAGAFGANRPERDLLLSQAHSVFVDGLLIPIGNLVNGKSIIIDRSIDGDRIVYYHIELDTHTAVFAEGLACESLQASKACRKRFDNYYEYLSLYSDVAKPDLAAFAPFGGYNGGRSELKCVLRDLVSKVWDVRNGYQKVRDQIDERANVKRSTLTQLYDLVIRLAQQQLDFQFARVRSASSAAHNFMHNKLSSPLSH